jgi:intracellular sulfur oxidation DsrE/DsrF family protein
MKDDRDYVSEQQLHAFVDGELDSTEKNRVFELAEHAPDIDTQLCEYRKLKEMLRHAYADPPRPSPARPFGGGKGSMSLRLVAGFVLLVVGALAGWIAHGPIGPDAGGQAGAPAASGPIAAASGVPAQSDRLLLHVASSDPASLEAALDLAERAIGDGSGRLVEVVANEGGLDLLRSDVTPFAERVAELSERQVLFFACSTAIQRLRDKGVEVRVLPQANVEYSALDRVVLRLQEGWAYQKI